MKFLKSLLISTVSVIAFSSAHAKDDNKAYLNINSTEVEVKSEGKVKTLDLEVKVDSDIPMDGKSGAFGYAALTDGGNNVLVAVTHLPIDDSSHEHPKSGFHTHVLDLKAPSKACEGTNFEVDVESSGKNKGFDADYKWKVKGKKLKLKDVPVSELADAGVESVVSFSLKPIFDNKKELTNLCVTVVAQD